MVRRGRSVSRNTRRVRPRYGSRPARYRRYKNRRRYHKRALRSLVNALEPRKKYFESGTNDMLGMDTPLLYNPLYWLAQGTTDIAFTGNQIYPSFFSIKGTLTLLPNSTSLYAGPCYINIMLFRTNDEIATGAITEGWTISSVANGWFKPDITGSKPIGRSYIDKSRAKCLYKKKIVLSMPNMLAINSAGTTNVGRAFPSVQFYCSYKPRGTFQFKESTAGVGNGYGKYYNYYWLIRPDSNSEWPDIQTRFVGTHLCIFKDI